MGFINTTMPVTPATPAVQFSFKHGAFAKVNYLGYDDHVVLNRSISFLHGEDVKVSGGGGEEKKKKSKKTGKKGSKEKGEDGEKGKKGKGENENEDEARGEGGGGSRAGGKLLTILTVRSASCELRAARGRAVFYGVWCKHEARAERTGLFIVRGSSPYGGAVVSFRYSRLVETRLLQYIITKMAKLL